MADCSCISCTPKLLLVNGFQPIIVPMKRLIDEKFPLDDALYNGGFKLPQIATAMRWAQDQDLRQWLDDLRLDAAPPAKKSRFRDLLRRFAPSRRAAAQPRSGGSGRWMNDVGSAELSVARRLKHDGGRWVVDDIGRVLVEDIGNDRGLLLAELDPSAGPIGESLPAGAGFAVVVHGAGDPDNRGLRVRVPVESVEAGSRGEMLFDAAQLAQILPAHLPGDVDGSLQSLTLVACDSGLLAGGFAQQLADQTGRDVLAPVEPVGIGFAEHPSEIVSTSGQSWMLFLSARRDGGDDLHGEGYDVLNDGDLGGGHRVPFLGITSLRASRAGGAAPGASGPAVLPPAEPVRGESNSSTPANPVHLDRAGVGDSVSPDGPAMPSAADTGADAMPILGQDEAPERDTEQSNDAPRPDSAQPWVDGADDDGVGDPPEVGSAEQQVLLRRVDAGDPGVSLPSPSSSSFGDSFRAPEERLQAEQPGDRGYHSAEARQEEYAQDAPDGQPGSDQPSPRAVTDGATHTGDHGAPTYELHSDGQDPRSHEAARLDEAAAAPAVAVRTRSDSVADSTVGSQPASGAAVFEGATTLAQRPGVRTHADLVQMSGSRARREAADFVVALREKLEAFRAAAATAAAETDSGAGWPPLSGAPSPAGSSLDDSGWSTDTPSPAVSSRQTPDASASVSSLPSPTNSPGRHRRFADWLATTQPRPPTSPSSGTAVEALVTSPRWDGDLSFAHLFAGPLGPTPTPTPTLTPTLTLTPIRTPTPAPTRTPARSLMPKPASPSGNRSQDRRLSRLRSSRMRSRRVR